MKNKLNEENQFAFFEVVCVIISGLFCWWLYEHPIIKDNVNIVLDYFK